MGSRASLRSERSHCHRDGPSWPLFSGLFSGFMYLVTLCTSRLRSEVDIFWTVGYALLVECQNPFLHIFAYIYPKFDHYQNSLIAG